MEDRCMSVTECRNPRHYGVLCMYHEHELPKVPKLLDKDETMIGEYCDSDTYSALVVYNPMLHTHKILIERRKQFRKELVFFRFQQEYERLEDRNRFAMNFTNFQSAFGNCIIRLQILKESLLLNQIYINLYLIVFLKPPTALFLLNK